MTGGRFFGRRLMYYSYRGGFIVNTYVYSYRLTTFGGAAPAYDNGLFSLAICKTDMRRVIGKRWHNEDKPNIWVIGINGKGLQIGEKRTC
jgi:hypothetical protein